MAQKKRILQVSPFDDICIIGISSTVKDYKLAWLLNQNLKLDLKKMQGLALPDRNNGLFSFYYFDEGENLNVFNLVQNHSEGQRMLQFSLPVDFFLIIRNPIPKNRFEEVMSTIRKTPGVMLVFEIDIDKNKNIDPMLERIEFHEFNLLKEQMPKRLQLRVG
ncbi:MAG: IPExxxVDY family protein [Bacteroidales bacterium]|nr:IPExxxVDY family protein [Bacteroidales bacterium]